MHYSGVMYGETKLAISHKRKRKSKIPKYFLLIWSRATCTCKIKPVNASYGLKHYIILFKYSRRSQAVAIHGRTLNSPASTDQKASIHQPASRPAASDHSSTDPTLRANPFPKVTNLFCRLPLPTLFYQLEAYLLLYTSMLYRK